MSDQNGSVGGEKIRKNNFREFEAALGARFPAMSFAYQSVDDQITISLSYTSTLNASMSVAFSVFWIESRETFSAIIGDQERRNVTIGQIATLVNRAVTDCQTVI